MDCVNAQRPVTNDLRRWWEIHMQRMADDELREGFGNLCAAIDALHASLEAENAGLRKQKEQLTEAQNEAWNRGFDEGFASADDWLAEHGWVRLPVDANGEPIRLGDELADYSELKHDGEVCRLMLDSDGWWVGFGISGWSRVGGSHEWHHRQPDSWERIIEDALDGYHDTDFDALVARCKALAGERA